MTLGFLYVNGLGIRKQIIFNFKALVENPDYGILIVGYSLGGGVASLITEELLYRQRQNEDVPNETMIRCITYGAPPTYSCPENYKNPNRCHTYN